MSRILQMRRGSVAENNAYTGMPGEVTVDTTNNTLRVHDGVTLGGFALARANDTTPGGGANFDITSVPDEVWAEIIPSHTPAPYTVQTSDLCEIPTNRGLMCMFSGNKLPFSVQIVLVCQNADAGYDIGDEVAAFGIGTRCTPTPNVYIQDDSLRVFLITGGAAFWVVHNQTGAATNIVNENWRIRVRVYC